MTPQKNSLFGSNVLKDIFPTFQSTRHQRKDHHPDLIQHTGHYYDSNSGVGSRPPKRFSRYQFLITVGIINALELHNTDVTLTAHHGIVRYILNQLKATSFSQYFQLLTTDSKFSAIYYNVVSMQHLNSQSNGCVQHDAK